MLSDFDTCPLDSMGNPSYCVAGTIIDHREWTDNQGVVHKNQKRLFIAKGKAREKIVRELDKKEDLKYCVYSFSRGSSSTECSTGEDINFVKQLSKDQLKIFIPKGETVKWLDPFDYEKILAPKSAEELRKLTGEAAPAGSVEETQVEEDTDDKSPKKEKKSREEKEVSSIDDLL